MAMVIKRFDVYLVNLDPVIGSEIQKTRPCVVISPDEMNRSIASVIIAPMTTQSKDWPTRFVCHFDGKSGQVALDQIKTIDNIRMTKYLGRLNAKEQKAVLRTVIEMFAE